jgi:hypothetical protein
MSSGWLRSADLSAARIISSAGYSAPLLARGRQYADPTLGSLLIRLPKKSLRPKLKRRRDATQYMGAVAPDCRTLSVGRAPPSRRPRPSAGAYLPPFLSLNVLGLARPTTAFIDTYCRPGRVSDVTVSGILQAPADARACYVMAHGAGAGMTHSFMAAVANGLTDRSIATLRYQIPTWSEARGDPIVRLWHIERFERPSRGRASTASTAPYRRR